MVSLYCVVCKATGHLRTPLMSSNINLHKHLERFIPTKAAFVNFGVILSQKISDTYLNKPLRIFV